MKSSVIIPRPTPPKKQTNKQKKQQQQNKQTNKQTNKAKPKKTKTKTTQKTKQTNKQTKTSRQLTHFKAWLNECIRRVQFSTGHGGREVMYVFRIKKVQVRARARRVIFSLSPQGARKNTHWTSTPRTNAPPDICSPIKWRTRTFCPHPTHYC